jgi:hypothetical protein
MQELQSKDSNIVSIFGLKRVDLVLKELREKHRWPINDFLRHMATAELKQSTSREGAVLSAAQSQRVLPQ